MERAPRWARAATAAALLLTACAGGGHSLRLPHLPRIGTNLLPPVVSYAAAADTATMSGRRWHRLRTPAYDLYVQSPAITTAVDERLEETARQFARHFGGAPRVAVLVFDGPAEPTREFDFSAFQAAHTQVLAFVRSPKAQRAGELGVDEGLLRARLAELFLAAYADSVVADRTGRWDGEGTTRSVERLPHWFAEAVISRVARPETVEPGLAYLRANRPHVVPLRRLFRVARAGAPAWCELATRRLPSLSVTTPRRGGAPPPVLLAAESTVFGEFLVDRYGPTFLQAMGEALLDGMPTERVLATLPGEGEEGSALEASWGEWLARRR